MRIVIVGSGAIGRLFGSFLVRGDNEITLIDIDQNTLDALQTKGIGLLDRDSEHPEEVQLFPVNAFSSAKSLTEADLVLLLVKSQATQVAVQDVAHLISDSCPLLCIQTGLGNFETARNIVPEKNILLGITFMSGTALSDGRVKKGGFAKTYIGEKNGAITPRLEAIDKVFNQCGIDTQMVKRIFGRLWCKVIIFAAINPVSAIIQVPNGSLTSKAESVSLMRRLLDEGRAVADAKGIDLVCDDLYELLEEVCSTSSNNLSSMLQDVLNEVATEIDAQNGEICRYAEETGIKVPTHQTILELIKLLECWKPGGSQT